RREVTPVPHRRKKKGREPYAAALAAQERLGLAKQPRAQTAVVVPAHAHGREALGVDDDGCLLAVDEFGIVGGAEGRAGFVEDAGAVVTQVVVECNLDVHGCSFHCASLTRIDQANQAVAGSSKNCSSSVEPRSAAVEASRSMVVVTASK